MGGTGAGWQGEGTRQVLIGEGVLDVTLKVLHDGDGLVFPVLEEHDGAARYVFEEQPGRIELPRHEQVGGIAIMQENDRKGAALILASRPSLHTVLFPTSEVAGEYRTRTYAVLAGTDTTRTEVIEHGHRFAVDLAGAYFSARLSTERQHIFGQMQEHELVLDMFAGVGPFAITLAPRASLVVAVDLNPQAILLMIENIRKNRAKNVIPLLADARRLEKILPWKFDRIIDEPPACRNRIFTGSVPARAARGHDPFLFARLKRRRASGPDQRTGRDTRDRTRGPVVLARAVARGV